MSESIANPILNSPYKQPDRYFQIGSKGPTGEIKIGRRPSESYIPIAPSTSRPFDKPKTGKVAVKVINYGDEVMKVFECLSVWSGRALEDAAGPRPHIHLKRSQNERRAFGHVDVSAVEIGQHPSLDVRRILMLDAQPRPYDLVGEQTPGERGAC